MTDDNAVVGRIGISGWIRSFAAVSLTFVFAAMALGQTNVTSLNFELVGSGLNRPVFATSAPGDSDSLFVLEQHAGTIQRIDLSTGTRSTFATLPGGTLSTGNEQGLLGLAFHPDYQTNGLYYLNYTDAGGDTRVREYTRQSPTQGSANATRDILSVGQPFTNHNAGWMGFGQDNNLYIATGDGGSGNDPGNNSQTITNNLLGKILRINVDGDDFAGDASRNYRFQPPIRLLARQVTMRFLPMVCVTPTAAVSIAPPTICGSVMSGKPRARRSTSFPRAHQDRISVGKSARGTLGNAVAGAIDPVYQYTRGSGDTQGRSVTGGYVYRGTISELDGHYFFADYVNNRIWSFKFNQDDQANFDGTNFTDFNDWSDRIENGLTGTINNVSSFGEDNDGNLFVVSLSGNVFRLNSVTTLGDVNLDGSVNFSDIPPFISLLIDEEFQAEADCDKSGVVDFSDIPAFIDILISQ